MVYSISLPFDCEGVPGSLGSYPGLLTPVCDEEPGSLGACPDFSLDGVIGGIGSGVLSVEQVIGSKRTHTIAKTIHETISIVRFLPSFFGVFRLILVNN